MSQETDVSRQKIGAHEPESHFIMHISLFFILVNDTLMDLCRGNINDITMYSQ